MITISFATRNYRLIRRIHGGLITACVLLCIVLAGMLWATVSRRADIAAMARLVKDAETADEQLQPVLKEREQLVKDLTAMSGLLESRRLSWTRLLTRLEAVVPVGVALTRLEFNAKDLSLTLEGMAQSPEALRTLVVGMERSAAFKDPFLKHQSLEKGNISFNVIAVYHEDKSVGVAAGKR